MEWGSGDILANPGLGEARIRTPQDPDIKEKV